VSASQRQPSTVNRHEEDRPQQPDHAARCAGGGLPLHAGVQFGHRVDYGAL